LSWLDSVLGRTKPLKSNLDHLFGMSTAEVTLETEFSLKPTGGAAICFRPVSSGQFADLQKEIDALLKASTKDSPLTWSSSADNFGYQWIVLHAAEFANLVATIHMVSRELEDSGFGASTTQPTNSACSCGFPATRLVLLRPHPFLEEP